MARSMVSTGVVRWEWPGRWFGLEWLDGSGQVDVLDWSG